MLGTKDSRARLRRFPVSGGSWMGLEGKRQPLEGVRPPINVVYAVEVIVDRGQLFDGGPPEVRSGYTWLLTASLAIDEVADAEVDAAPREVTQRGLLGTIGETRKSR